MGVPKDQATRNRQAIVETASRVFRERGVDGVGVADLMKEAGFTHGGFYNHFASKEALAAEACAAAFAAGAANLQDAATADAGQPGGKMHALLETYLSPNHCEEPGTGCPMAALAVDAARHGHDMQSAYAQGIEGFVQALTAYLAASPQHGPEGAREAAIKVLANLVGSVVIARGVGTAAPALLQEVLAAGRKGLPP